MMMRLTLYLLLFILFALGCAPHKDNIPVADAVITAPHQVLTRAELLFYENGVKRWRLDADYMDKPLTDTGNIFVAPVRIVVYDTVGEASMHITSDSGSCDAPMNVFDLRGNVFIKNEDGLTVKSEQLRWHKTRRKITSETYVQIETPKGDILSGKGLDAIDDFSWFSFSAEVQGKFPDFRRRIEENDEDFFL